MGTDQYSIEQIYNPIVLTSWVLKLFFPIIPVDNLFYKPRRIFAFGTGVSIAQKNSLNIPTKVFQPRCNATGTHNSLHRCYCMIPLIGCMSWPSNLNHGHSLAEPSFQSAQKFTGRARMSNAHTHFQCNAYSALVYLEAIFDILYTKSIKTKLLQDKKSLSTRVINPSDSGFTDPLGPNCFILTVVTPCYYFRLGVSLLWS